MVVGINETNMQATVTICVSQYKVKRVIQFKYLGTIVVQTNDVKSRNSATKTNPTNVSVL